ncbi:MAG: hypothetical protein EAX81_04115 [Candidatus Thorarchaeota archaeon]|nr:hypothetical protein [Candidatus Thorarchaeota archaeon]
MIFKKAAGRHMIFFEVREIGNDLLVAVSGGDECHIGGVAVSYPTPSHYRSATTVSLNSITLPGHKDYIIANSTAVTLTKALNRPVVVTVGIHYDNVTKVEIDEIIKVVESLTNDAISHYQKPE